MCRTSIHMKTSFPPSAHRLPQTSAAPALYKLEKLLTNKMTVAKLSPSTRLHLWRISTAPSFVLHQRTLFQFLGMLCRLYLAAMYYNENADKPHITSGGDQLFRVRFPKAMRGGRTTKPVKTEPTFGISLSERCELVLGLPRRSLFGSSDLHHVSCRLGPLY